MLGLSYPGTSSRVTVASLVASSSIDGVHTVYTIYLMIAFAT